MGLPFSNDFEFTDNEFTRHIQTMYDMMNREGLDLQLEIDRHWLALMMVYSNSPLLDTLSWKYFVLKKEDVLTHESLPDIGQCVRLLSTRNNNNDVMCRMIQYSLPYIKHNRLTFAKFEEVSNQTLVDLIHILLGMCLGIHNKTCKKPVWRLRFRIVTYIHSLLTQGSQYDLYLFCTNNLNMIRIAIVEYFVYFVQRYMPCEFEMLRHLFGMQANVENICLQFQLNVNHFRSNHMQTDILAWRDLNSKAHVIIEKCNRICKGKPRITVRRNRTREANNCINEKNVKAALAMPAIEHVALARFFNVQINANLLKSVKNVHSTIRVHVLPNNITQAQCMNLKHALYHDTKIFSRSVYMYQCLKCKTTTTSGKLNGQLRTDASGNVSCCICSNKDTVVRINVLGRIVEVFDNKYYFCRHCMTIHKWLATGQEFTSCSFKCKQNSNSASRQCLLCPKMHNLHEYAVLDDSLGVMSTFLLCGKHMPWSHQNKCIYNFETLGKAIQFKLKHSNNI